MDTILQEPQTEGLLDQAARTENVLLSNIHAQVMPINADQMRWTMHGWRHYGKGRHKAALNLGDCFCYGPAKATDAPLLLKGEDFQYTDVKVAA